MPETPAHPEIFVDWNAGSPEQGSPLTTVGATEDFSRIGLTARDAVGMRCVFYTDGDETGDVNADDALVYIGTVVLAPRDGTPIGVKDPGTRVLTRGEMVRSGYDFSDDDR